MLVCLVSTFKQPTGLSFHTTQFTAVENKLCELVKPFISEYDGEDELYCCIYVCLRGEIPECFPYLLHLPSQSWCPAP